MKISIQKAKQRLTLFLVLILIFTASGIHPVQARDENVNTYEGEGYRISFRLTSSWDGGYEANVTLENTEETKLENWCIVFPLQETINSIWNARIEESKDGCYRIKNDGWNQDIAPSGSVTFGFSVNSTFTGFPDRCFMQGRKETVPKTDYDISYKIESDWESGFVGNMTITNLSETTLEDWVLDFDFDNEITSIWDADIKQHTPNHYIVHKDQDIRAGESVRFGFTVNNGSSANQPSGLSLTQMNTRSANTTVVIDVRGFTHSDTNDLYFVNDSLETLTGTLKPAYLADYLEYVITSYSGATISSGKIPVAEEWSFCDFNLSYGTNHITVTATGHDGTKVSDTLDLYNSSMENLGNALENDTLIQDILSQDSDSDGLCDLIETEIIGTDAFKTDTDENGIPDGKEDQDKDGLSNLREVELETNPIVKDTDGDGLTDKEEADIYHTNPHSPDTDDDKASDKWELDHGYDPCVSNASFNASETVTLSEDIPNVSVNLIRGNGAAAESLAISKVENILFNHEIPGYLGSCCEFSADGAFERAEVSYTLDPELFQNKNFIPVLYYFNEDTQLLEEVSGQTLDGNVVRAELPHFSKYILLDKQNYEASWDYTLLYDEDGLCDYKGMDIVFAIDSSGSMSWNDQKGIRKTVTKKFIDLLTEQDQAAIVDFDSYASVYSGFTNNTKSLYQAVDRIDNSGGTNLSYAMSASINLFTSPSYQNDGKAKYIVMLTDGEGNYNTSYTQKAKENGIVVYTVGLGSSVSTSLLTGIAKGTDGEYYHASNSDKLFGIFNSIADQTDLYKDSDSDKLNDYYEKEMNQGNLRLGTGVKLTGVNYLDCDTDQDGLLDGEEVKVNKAGNKVYVTLYSNPILEDTDGDGLLDGAPKMINKKKAAPKDPDPLYANGPVGIWQAQFAQELSGNIPRRLDGWYDCDFNWGALQGGLNSELATALGSKVLRFKLDDKKSALHSQVDTWQAFWGYNDLYDSVFDFGTNGNMDKIKFTFNTSSKDYVIWAWRGDYLNLGSGAELGIYTNPHRIPILNIEQWDTIDFTLPMTLNLYNYYGSDHIENIFSWAPEEGQWWITGFNPDFSSPDAKRMVSLGSIDFAGREDMYRSLKASVTPKERLNDFMIFDEDGHTVWFEWWEK